MNVITTLKYISVIPRSLFYCLRMLPLRDAIHLPIIIGHNVKIYGCYRGCILFSEKVKMGMVRIGMWEGAGKNGYGMPTIINVDKCARIRFGQNIVIAQGSKVRVMESGQLTFGNDFKGNYGLEIMCRKEVSFGEDCLLAWNCTITDGDGHSLLIDEKRINADKPVVLGNHVWLCAHSTLLKGTRISNGSVVAYGSVCCGGINIENILWGGVPGKVIKTGVTWCIDNNIGAENNVYK